MGQRNLHISICYLPFCLIGLALVASLMANGGRHGDFRFLSPSTVNRFHEDAIERLMTHAVNYFVVGGVSEERLPTNPTDADRKTLRGLEGFFGWGGYGGSQMQWHPEDRYL